MSETASDLPPLKDSDKKGLVAFFVRRFVFSVALFSALALFGFSNIPKIGVDILPKFEVPVVAISTTYPGAGPEEIATQVSKPIEDSLSTLDGIDSIGSTSSEGVSVVVVQFTSDKKVDQAAVDVSQRVSAIRGTLPRDANAPVISKFDPSANAILSVAVSAPGRDLTDLAQYADQTLKPVMQRVAGVADVQVQGGPKREIQILLNPSKLQSLGLNPAAIINAVSSTSLSQAGGSLNIGKARNLITLRNTAVKPADVEKMLVDPQRGIRMGDVAVVRDTSEELGTLSRVNGEAVVSLSVRKSPNANSVQVAENLRLELAKLSSALKVSQTALERTATINQVTADIGRKDGTLIRGGYTLRIVSDTTKSIKGTVNDTWSEVIVTIVAVSLVCLIFLGRLNTVFAVVLAIPISLSGALILFGILGFTFNIISLLAITVAVGIVVDDSIVVAENVERYRKMGYGLKDSVLKGTGEVLSAVSASTMSLIAVFLPISFLPGIVGQFFQQFGLVLAASVAMSWAEALFFLTVRMAYTPDPEPIHKFSDLFKLPKRNFWTILTYPFSILFNLLNLISEGIHQISEMGFNRLQSGYAKLLASSLKRPWIVLTVAFMLFLSVGYVGPRLPFNFTPKQDSGIMTLIFELPKGTTLSETNALVKPVEDYVLTRPEVDILQTTVGSSANSGTGSAERATLSVTLKPKGTRPPIDDVIALYRKDLGKMLANRPDAKFKVQVPQGGPPQDGDYVVTLNAPTPELLRERSDRFLELLRKDGRFVDVRSTLSQTTAEKVFIPDPIKLSGTGLTALDIANTLRAYNAGTQAAVLRRDGQEQPIIVKADPRFVQNESDLLSLPVFSQVLGSAVPLGSLGSFENKQSPASLSRTDQSYSAGIQANKAEGVTTGALQLQNDIAKKLKDQGITDDTVVIGTSGAAAFVGDLATAAPRAFLLALLLNYLVIASQFNSFRYPIYLLIPVPLALIGAFWLAYALGTGLDVISVLATVLLIGLVTKNAILLLDFVMKEARNMDLRSALIQAGRLRLRPILMTTITVFIISFPLILGIGEGGELRKPLGVIILGGLLTSTLLTLFVVPSAFYLFERKRHERDQKLEQNQNRVSGTPIAAD